MYSACLFCHSALGSNELIESFPVGRRLAYDAAKGRLWVVCRRCERWNLTPLDERWAAIDECERSFRDTRTRIATSEIGLARVRDSHGAMDIVRIGRPMLPEYAAWRYGDQFGRRRRRHVVLSSALVAGVGTVAIGGALTGVITFGAVLQLWNFWSIGQFIRDRRPFRLPAPDGSELRIHRLDLAAARLIGRGDDWRLEVTVLDEGESIRKRQRRQVTFEGAPALRAVGRLLPWFNRAGASSNGVQEAVGLVERYDRDSLFDAARDVATREAKRIGWYSSKTEGGLGFVPRPLRLALEMVAHEESERRALEGELALLEASWRDAEAIAGIADAL